MRVKEGFATEKSKLRDATVTIGKAVWRGDFRRFKASPTALTVEQPVETVTQTELPKPTETEVEPTITEPSTTEQAAECAEGAVTNDGGGTYSTCTNGQWVHIEPTFDPDSGDGYGPNQPLPPLCVRFPDDYDC